MLVTVERTTTSEGPIEVRGPIDTERIDLGPAIERKIDEIDYFNIDRTLQAEGETPDTVVTVEIVEPPQIHFVQFQHDNEQAKQLGVTDLVELIESTGVPPHLVTFDEVGHKVPFHPPIECSNWSAWYDREPGSREDPNLRVTGECTIPIAGVKLTLEPGNVGVAPQPGLLALELKAEFPDVSTQVVSTVTVNWEDDVGPDIEKVRIQGAANAEIDVTIAE